MWKSIVATCFVLPAAGITYIWFVLLSDLSPPFVDETAHWGPAATKGQPDDTAIRPFKIAIIDHILNDLRARLALETLGDGEENSRLVPPLEGIGFQYGFNSNYLMMLGSYWAKTYDWRTREAALNKYPHFKTTINGIEIHFQHAKSVNSNKYKLTRPLLLLHGWPGSFTEFQKIIPLLIDPKESGINFELVIPSLPGFGFSEGPHAPGLGAIEMCPILHKLMKRLGYQMYYVHGGNWGGYIASIMGSLYPGSINGIHLTSCLNTGLKSQLKTLLASIYPTFFMSPEEAAVIYPLAQNMWPILLEETGYAHIQATKPDTIGAVLSNSPTGLLAYILEKFSTWTNKEWRTWQNGGLLPHYKLADLLDNVMIYWVTNSITTAMRLYAETLNVRQFGYKIDRVPVPTPTACLQPPKDAFGWHSSWVLKDRYHNLRRFTIAAKGGHFMALETPELLANDVLVFFNLLENDNTLLSKNEL